MLTVILTTESIRLKYVTWHLQGEKRRHTGCKEEKDRLAECLSALGVGERSLVDRFQEDLDALIAR